MLTSLSQIKCRRWCFTLPSSPSQSVLRLTLHSSFFSDFDFVRQRRSFVNHIYALRFFYGFIVWRRPVNLRKFGRKYWLRIRYLLSEQYPLFLNVFRGRIKTSKLLRDESRFRAVKGRITTSMLLREGSRLQSWGFPPNRRTVSNEFAGWRRMHDNIEGE